MNTHCFRFSRKRFFHNLLGLIPLIGFPLVLKLLGQNEPIIFTLFGIAAVLLLIGVIYAACRFKVTLTDDMLDCRGSLHHRKISLADIKHIEIRKRRSFTTRTAKAYPFKEMVIQSSGKQQRLSSLPLGRESFEELLTALRNRLSAEVFENK